MAPTVHPLKKSRKFRGSFQKLSRVDSQDLRDREEEDIGLGLFEKKSNEDRTEAIKMMLDKDESPWSKNIKKNLASSTLLNSNCPETAPFQPRTSSLYHRSGSQYHSMNGPFQNINRIEQPSNQTRNRSLKSLKNRYAAPNAPCLKGSRTSSTDYNKSNLNTSIVSAAKTSSNYKRRNSNNPHKSFMKESTQSSYLNSSKLTQSGTIPRNLAVSQRMTPALKLFQKFSPPFTNGKLSSFLYSSFIHCYQQSGSRTDWI